MNLDTGRLTMLEAAQLGGLAVGSLFIAALGGLMSWGAGPGQHETLQSLGGFRFWIWFFGSSVGLVAFSLGAAVVVLTVRSWLRYEQRLQDWHEVSMEAVIQNQGVEVSQTLTAWELTPSTPRDVLLVALAVHARVQAGESNAHTVRALAGACWLGDIRLGDVGGGQPERIAKAFTDLGLVKGKAARKAGEWIPESTDQVIELVDKNWRKVRLS
jgi:hypothetical protein